jgi:hypothetical protein
MFFFLRWCAFVIHSFNTSLSFRLSRNMTSNPLWSRVMNATECLSLRHPDGCIHRMCIEWQRPKGTALKRKEGRVISFSIS